MSESGYDLRRLEKAVQRRGRAAVAAEKARNELYAEITAARKAGVTIADIARIVGVSRQRMQQILARIDPPPHLNS